MNGTDASRQISAAQYGPAVQAAVLDNKLHLENAAAFNRLDAGDQEAFLSLSKDLQLSLQTEREFLEWLPEIAYSRKQSVASVLQAEEINSTRNSPILNAPQKIEKIRACVFSMRFPQYDAALKQWKQVANKAFGDTSNIAVMPNPYFEKNRLELRIRISNADEAEEVMRKLAALPKSTWASLIDPMIY
jgi:hypothetical protein